MTPLSSISLNNSDMFQIISGLWKGTLTPLQRCAVLRSTNFRSDGLLDYSNIAELDVEERQLAQRQLRSGDIIIERSGGGPKQPVGRIVFFSPPSSDIFCTSNFTSIIRVKKPSILLPQFVAFYLHYIYLSGATERLQRATTGIRNLDWNEYLKFEIPLLPLAEQNNIVTLLHHVRSLYLNEETQITIFKKLKQDVMHTLFTRGLRNEKQKDTKIGLIPESWKVVSFSSIRQWLQYGTSVRCTEQIQTYPVLRIPNIEPGRVLPSNLKYCNLSEKEANRYLLENGDFLFIRTNGVIERLGACAVYSGSPPQALFASYLIRAKLHRDLVEPKFAAHFFASPTGVDLIASSATPAADGKYNLNTGTIDALLLPLPPSLDEQCKIIEILDSIDKKIDIHKQKQTVLENLFKTLLHNLMTAETQLNDLDFSTLSKLNDIAGASV